MDERMRRQWAATEARRMGYGGMSRVSQATGLSRTTIAAGLAELDLPLDERLREAA
ncbi:MAG TPA: ISAzo13 family transposase, partial [Humisphaera sp.]|nr:ISAzo13 family transposase [Humisphaera sp.]